MIIYENNNTAPYYNLACEQYLLDAEPLNEEIFMLWRNEPSVIMGRNQNAYVELNMEFIEKNKITAVRRLTGGGAVFHDLGNVNFTFIMPGSKENKLNFDIFTRPIIKALNKLNVNAELSGRNDIVVDGYKISGNAQCSYNGKILHHGTLLFNADLLNLAGSLNVDEEKIKSKGIKSVRSRVANIKSFLSSDMDTVEFIKYIECNIDAEKKNFTFGQIKSIQKLADDKYSTWEWNFGQSKQYSFTKKRYFPFGLVELNVNTDGGYIYGVRICGDYFGLDDINELEKILTGVKYETESIKKKLSEIQIDKYIYGAKSEDIINMLIS